MRAFKFLSLSLIIALTGCAQIPKWSDQPQDCSYLKNSRDYICVDEPEVVKMPSYIQLLEVPPAKQMPVVQYTDSQIRLDKEKQETELQISVQQ